MDLEDELLDDKDLNLTNHKLMQYISWWERGRIFFNFTLITAYGIAIFVNWHNALNMGWGELAFWLFIYGGAANIFYTMGWSTELLREYYWGGNSQFLFRNKVWIWLMVTVSSGGFLYHLIARYLENWAPFVFFEF